MEASVAQHKNATEQAARSQTAEAEAEKQRLSAQVNELQKSLASTTNLSENAKKAHASEIDSYKSQLSKLRDEKA